MKRWILAAIICLLMAADALAAPVRVRQFDAFVDVAGNGDIVVNETLTVEIPAEGEFHGIFRDIPVTTRWPRQPASMEVLAVSLDGRPLPADDVRRSPGLVRVYQRDRERRLTPGRHEFFLSYRMTGQIGLFEDNDELTWNVTGSGWEAPVEQASCVVLCPAGAPFFGQRAWIGRAGSKNSPVSMSYEVQHQRLVMRFDAQRAVQPGEDFTVAAGWGKGFVAPAGGAVVGSLSGAMAYAVLDAALFLYFFLAWFFTGREPRKGVIVPLFHPPVLRRGNGKSGERDMPVSPAAAGYVFHKNRVTPACFGAAVISLAGRGCCRILGNAKEGFVLEPGRGSSPFAEEERILKAMGRESVRVDAAHGKTLYGMQRAMTAQLRRDYGSMWKGAGGGFMNGLFGSVWMFLGMAAALIGLAAVTGWVTGGALPHGVVPALGFQLFAFFFVQQMIRLIVSRLKSGSRGFVVCALVMILAMLGISLAVLFAVFRDAAALLSPIATALAALAVLIPFGFSFIMDRPTREARALLDQIEGLELYMRMAEGPALNALNPPERTLEHYRELLPYAVALGLEQAWGAHFSGALGAAALSGGQELTPALAGAFASAAEGSIGSYAGAQASAASSSSSFGGDGGGAGSGGGGGGGGGC